MKNFIENYQISITPLCPIHLGSGEDFLPTNYLIDNNLLYEFDPSEAILNDAERQKLLLVANSNDIRDVYLFFKNNPLPFRLCAQNKIAVSNKLSSDYRNKLGQNVQKNNNNYQQNRNGSKKQSVINDLSIACTAKNYFNHQAIIPGSALKGCVRTVVLDRLLPADARKKYKNDRDEKKLQQDLLGSFNNDAFSAFKASDLSQRDENIRTYAQYAYNYKKTGQDKTAKQVPIRLETITPNQYQAFQGELTICEKKDAKKLPHIKEMIKALNKYHLRIWNKELELLLEKDIADSKYLKNIDRLITTLNLQNNDNIALIRLGKLCGAESKTLPELAQIKIMQGKGKQPVFRKETTTIWLTEGNLPFGWALLEINTTQKTQIIKDYCEQNNHLLQYINEQIDTADKNTLSQFQQQKETEEKQRREQIQKAKEEEEKQKQEEIRLNNLSDFEREIEDWQNKLLSCKDFNKSNEIYTDFKAYLAQAVEKYSADEKRKLAEIFSRKNCEKNYPKVISSKRSKELSPILAKLRGE